MNVYQFPVLNPVLSRLLKNSRMLIGWLAVNLVALLGFCAVIGLVTYESQFKKYKPESECVIKKNHLKPLFWIFLTATRKKEGSSDKKTKESPWGGRSDETESQLLD